MLYRRLDQNHDMIFGIGLSAFVTQLDAVAQSIKTRLYLIRGEWMLDTDAGTPYFEDVFVRPLDVTAAEAAIKQTILETEDVTGIVEFSLDLDRNTRKALVQAVVSTIYGNLEITL